MVAAIFVAPWLTRSLAGEGVSWWVGFLIVLIPLVAVSLLLQAALLRPVRRTMSKIRIPSVIALFLGVVLVQSADRLAGPKVGQTDQQWVIREVAGMGGLLICLFAAAGLLHTLRKHTLVS